MWRAVRCTQSARYLCVNIDANDSASDSFILTGIGTQPVSMYGQAVTKALPLHGSDGFCLVRPGAEGTMKALAVVARQGSSGNGIYTVRAECFSPDFIGYTSRGTAAKLLQDE